MAPKMKTICILGRQSKLSLAELEAVFGADKVQQIGREAALVDAAPDVVQKVGLGGTIKLATLLETVPSAHWKDLVQVAHQLLLALLPSLPEGKLHLGLSVYGGKVVGTGGLQRTGLELKKAIRAEARSIRIVPNQQLALNSAQVLHNHLTGPQGIELLFVVHGKQTYLARTSSVQDIDEYAARDYGRPKRSGFVGMLPPKLAQMMLNLAQVKAGDHVLDPFCGTGVVLQEAALQNAKIHGTDLEPKMIDFSRTNLEWLQQKYQLTDLELGLEQGDARTMRWQPPIDHVVCETYLGQPLSSLPSQEKLEKIRSECNALIAQFLANLAPQLTPGTRSVIAIPAWRLTRGFLHLPVIDQLEKLGYNRISFAHASEQDLIYHRQDQIVARELLVLTRK